MTSDVVNGASFGSQHRVGRKAACTTLKVMLIAALGLLPMRAAAELDRGAAIGKSVVNEHTHGQLRERVRTSALLDVTDPRFPEIVIGGSRYGGHLFVSTVVHDPLNPETLNAYFDVWNLSARASLLLQYAQLRKPPRSLHREQGMSEDVWHNLQLHDAAIKADNARISQVVHAGRYASDWKPFLAAYGRFMTAAEEALPRTDTTDSRTLSDYKTVARVAREQGLYQLVRGIRIDPADVANEILRELHDARSKMGKLHDTDESAANLLYTCGAFTTTDTGSNPEPFNATINVNLHSWHKLAPAFFRAWQAVDRKVDDPDATRIVTAYLGLSSEIGSWVASHPNADSIARDRELNSMAAKRGLILLLQRYGSTSAASESAPADNSTSRW